MKANTTKEYHFTGDYYSYTQVTSADGTVTTKRYVTVPEQVKMSLTTNVVGELIIESQTKMQLEGYLKNVLDRGGEEIYIGGEWMIQQTQPVLDPNGYKDGYKYRASMIAGDI